MKELSTTMLRHFVRGFGVAVLFACATVGTAFADNISQTFEFGAGTPQPRSHVRTFPIPCGLGVVATVKFQRLGPDGPSNDIPITIEFREPDTAADQEGPVVETKTATAQKTEQTVILRTSQASNRGCPLRGTWRVRVKYANDGTPPSPTFGSIRLDFDPSRARVLEMDPSYPDINKGSSVTIKLGRSGGFEQGTIEIRATWIHAALRPGSNPIKLKWELIDPSGTVVKTAEAYSSDQEKGSDLPKFKLIYQVTKCVTGQWKLKITNLSTDDDAKFPEYDLSRVRKFTPDCP